MRGFLIVLLAAGCSGSYQPSFDVARSGTPGTARGIVEGSLWIDVPGAVDGAKVLLDTGAPFSALNPDVFDGVPQLNDRFAALTVAGVTFRNFWNFADFSALGGLLGVEVFGAFDTRFDYRARQLVFQPGAPPDGVSATIEHPFQLEGGVGVLGHFAPATRIIVPVTIEGRTLNMLLDTGSSYVLVRQEIFDDLVSDGRPTLPHLSASVGGQTFNNRVARLHTLELFGQTLEGVVVGIAPPEKNDANSAEVHRPLDGMLGCSALAHFAVDVDYPERVLRLHRYAGDDGFEDAYHAIGIELGLVSGPHRYQVNTVFPDSDAYAQGIREKDAILSIDGVDFDHALPFDALATLRGPVGSVKTVVTDKATLQVRVEELLP